MATDKRQFTLRLQDEVYEKIRYLAYVDRRSIAMMIEKVLCDYIARYEREHGVIQLPKEDEP